MERVLPLPSFPRSSCLPFFEILWDSSPHLFESLRKVLPPTLEDLWRLSLGTAQILLCDFAPKPKGRRNESVRDSSPYFLKSAVILRPRIYRNRTAISTPRSCFNKGGKKAEEKRYKVEAKFYLSCHFNGGGRKLVWWKMLRLGRRWRSFAFRQHV